MPSQPTSTITEIQLGCLAQCFGTTTTSTVPAPLAQQILDELSLLAPPTASTSPEPAPGADQTIVDQVSCQVQTGQPAPGTAVQIATQTSTTIQLIDPASVSQPTAGDQTEQQTWQLQIGCLFYCTDTQQLQHAQQTIATIQILVGQPGSSTSSATGGLGAASQVIWQLQIGCIAWCYDATQVQDATSQTTVTVILPVPPASPPPAPPPSETTDVPPTDTTDSPPQAPAGATVSTASPPATPAPAATTTLLLRPTAGAGIAILGRRPIAPTVAAPATARSEVVVSTVSLPASGSAPAPAPDAFRAHAVRPSSAGRRQTPRATAGTVAARTAPLEAAAGRPGSTPPLLLIALGFVAAAALWAFRGSRPFRRGR